MRKYIVNNKEVEYLHIEENHDGTIEVHFEEKFNIVTAHMSVIMARLRENNLKCQVFKDLKHNIISLWLQSITDVNGVLHVLSVPHACYEVLYEDAIVVIDVPKLQEIMEMELSTNSTGGCAYEKY